jgi:cytochrome c-type biogenesis protein CcmH
MTRTRAALGLASLLSVCAASAALAVNPEEQLPNRQQEARARTISRELRCVVCQSQTIDDSSAPVAQALRKLVRDRIVAGDSDAQIVAAVTARYGDFVLLKPRFGWSTSILWLGPFAVLGLGAAGAVFYVRRQEEVSVDPSPLTDSERAALAQTLDAMNGPTGDDASDAQEPSAPPSAPATEAKLNPFVWRFMTHWPMRRG